MPDQETLGVLLIPGFADWEYPLLAASAPGSAPGTFACAMLGAMMPEAGEQVAQMRSMFAREYAQGAA